MLKHIFSSQIIYVVVATLIVSGCNKKLDEVDTPDASLNREASNLSISKPNVILILGDDIGYEIPGYTGGQSWATPNIDLLATKGMQFTKCYSMPMCSPSRFELLTGKYNNRNYFENSWGDMDLSQKTLGNLMKLAGYSTCIAGKWQMNGGDSSIRTFGFDAYSVTNPYKVGTDEDEEGISLYKNPLIYQKAAYLPEAQTFGKYGEDINRDYLFGFMDSMSKVKKPFFAMWTPNLCHQPFSPTPDDPEFATWDPNAKRTDADTVFFGSMIKYFDKEIGMLINKLQAPQYKNTIVLLIIGDNGTNGKISSRYKGVYYKGGKGRTFDRGIHIPMIAYTPSGYSANTVNNSLVDFTDFMPTLAAVAGIKVPQSFGKMDGTNFLPQLLGNNAKARTSLFGYYNVNRHGPDAIPPIIWAMDAKFKLYEDTSTRFYNYITDINERNVIVPANMTSEQKKANSTLDSVIHHYLQ